MIVATSLLPSKSAEFGQDGDVGMLVRSIFGIDYIQAMPSGVTEVHAGKAVFVREPSAETLTRALQQTGMIPDVSFADNPAPITGNNCFGYIHKDKDGADIYYFGNSSDTPIATTVQLRGSLKLQLWDPATGSISALRDVKAEHTKSTSTTSATLAVLANSAVFFVSDWQVARKD